MTIKQLKAFLAVANTLNFAQACEILFISQPALSLAIKSLEEYLGGSLFSRTTRNVALTPEGEEFLIHAKQLIANWDKTIEMTQQRFELKRGTVSLAAMPSFASNDLPKLLKEFKNFYKDVNITVHDVIYEQVLKMILQNQVELGIGFEPEAVDSFNFVPLLDDKFVAVLPHSIENKRINKIKWEKLLESDFITLQRPSIARSIIESGLARTNLKLRVSYDCHQVTTIGRMVSSNLGVSAVPSICITQMRELGCHCVELTDPIVSRRIGIIYSKENQLSMASQEMINVIKKYYKCS
ncbi:TPA: LysR family transcriptional regulator [Acinetobacter baumannii]